jgi:membrane protein implicated in regulation of membrane protease activity
MKAATERKIIRWFHIIASIPVVGYMYGPVASIPQAAWTVKWIIFPLIVLSGFWLWLGHKVRKKYRRVSRNSALA